MGNNECRLRSVRRTLMLHFVGYGAIAQRHLVLATWRTTFTLP
jgi:hypothetical protein